MIRDSARIRRARWSAVGALALTCACVPAASARQAASGDATAKKPATAAPKKPATSAASAKPKSTSHVASSGKHSTHKKKTTRARGQQKIDSERATAIQEALIREHYLSGDAKGTWNQASEDAMRKYQADHGWQSKTVPDSRALIKLGLGPSKDHLLNPESAMTTVPSAPKSESAAPTTPTTPAASNPDTSSSPATVGSPASTDPSGPQRR